MGGKPATAPQEIERVCRGRILSTRTKQLMLALATLILIPLLPELTTRTALPRQPLAVLTAREADTNPMAAGSVSNGVDESDEDHVRMCRAGHKRLARIATEQLAQQVASGPQR
jgi:hypothetical protein